MGFTFHVQMLGLCHFVPNDEPESAERTRLCVLLPDLSGDPELGRNHEARLLYDEKKLEATPRRTPPEITVRKLASERVTFEYFYEDGFGPRTPAFSSDFKATVRMAEIVSTFADKHLSVVADTDRKIDRIVGSQILFDRGHLTEDPPEGIFEVPQFLKSSVRRGLPRFVAVREENLTKVVVWIKSFDGLREESLIFEVPDGDVRITLTADCDLQQAEKALSTPLLVPTRDEDFVAHYFFLDAASQKGLRELHPVELPVPVLLPLAETGSAEPYGLVARGGKVAIDRNGNLVLAAGGSDCQSLLAAARPLNLDSFLRHAP